MSNSLVRELEDWAIIVDGVQGKAAIWMLDGSVFADAANEIKRLQSLIDDWYEALSYHSSVYSLEAAERNLIKEACRGE